MIGRSTHRKHAEPGNGQIAHKAVDNRQDIHGCCDVRQEKADGNREVRIVTRSTGPNGSPHRVPDCKAAWMRRSKSVGKGAVACYTSGLEGQAVASWQG